MTMCKRCEKKMTFSHLVLSYKALMIEDHKEVRDFVKEYFDHKEIEVIEAQNGYEGLAILDDTIDIILLDIMMPGIDGYEVCKHLAYNKEGLNGLVI